MVRGLSIKKFRRVCFAHSVVPNGAAKLTHRTGLGLDLCQT